MAAALIGLGLAGLYFHWTRSLPTRYRVWIVTLRAILLGLLVLLFSDPELRYSRQVEVPPRIGIYLDNSLSMDNHPKASAMTVHSKAAAVLDWANRLDHETRVFTFGEQLTRHAGLSFEYQPSERLTDFELLEDTWRGENLAAAFLFSDGVATSGPDPGGLVTPTPMPIFTIGIGDTISGVDASIAQVHFPLSLLDGEKGVVGVTVKGSNADGRRSRLLLFNEGRLIHSVQIGFEGREHFQHIRTEVVGRETAPGFSLALSVLPGEINIENNQWAFQIDVLPSDIRMTILTGNLSPNTPLIQAVAGDREHVNLNHFFSLRGRWHGDEARFWNLSQSLVVLDNYPTETTPEEHLERLLGKFRRENPSVLVIEGPASRTRKFDRLLRALGLTPGTESRSAIGGTSLRLALASQPPSSPLKQLVERGHAAGEFPPVRLSHSLQSVPAGAGTPVLVDENGAMVVGFGQLSRGRAGQGKWGAVLLPDLAATHLKLRRTDWQAFLAEMVAELMEWGLEQPGFSPYVIRTDRGQYHLGEKVALRAMLRDRAGEKILARVLTMEVQGPSAATLVGLTYNFDQGEYQGEFWPPQSGHYDFRPSSHQEGELGRPAGSFQVQAGQIELETLVQNRYGLERMAHKTGGRYIELSEVDTLLAELAYKPRILTRAYTATIWDLRYLWAVLLALFGTEWIIRRLAGII